jgi:predicted dehydrogenase
MQQDEKQNFLVVSAVGGIRKGHLLTTSCEANDKVYWPLSVPVAGFPCVISCCKSNVNVEIKTVCDVDDLRSSAAVSEIEKQLGYKPRTTRYMKEVFDDRDVDAVWISTPDHWHALATIWACQAGKDVYVEKTPGLCIWEGRKMAEAAKKYRQIVQAGFQNRSGAYIGCEDYIQSGKLGQVVYGDFNLLNGTVDARPSRAPGTIGMSGSDQRHSRI